MQWRYFPVLLILSCVALGRHAAEPSREFAHRPIEPEFAGEPVSHAPGISSTPIRNRPEYFASVKHTPKESLIKELLRVKNPWNCEDHHVTNLYARASDVFAELIRAKPSERGWIWKSGSAALKRKLREVEAESNQARRQNGLRTLAVENRFSETGNVALETLIEELEGDQQYVAGSFYFDGWLAQNSNALKRCEESAITMAVLGATCYSGADRVDQAGRLVEQLRSCTKPVRFGTAEWIAAESWQASLQKSIKAAEGSDKILSHWFPHRNQILTDESERKKDLVREAVTFSNEWEAFQKALRSKIPDYYAPLSFCELYAADKGKVIRHQMLAGINRINGNTKHSAERTKLVQETLAALRPMIQEEPASAAELLDQTRGETQEYFLKTLDDLGSQATPAFPILMERLPRELSSHNQNQILKILTKSPYILSQLLSKNPDTRTSALNALIFAKDNYTFSFSNLLNTYRKTKDRDIQAVLAPLIAISPHVVQLSEEEKTQIAAVLLNDSFFIHPNNRWLAHHFANLGSSGHPFLQKAFLSNEDCKIGLAAAALALQRNIPATFLPGLRRALESQDRDTVLDAVRAIAALKHEAESAAPKISNLIKEDRFTTDTSTFARTLNQVSDNPVQYLLEGLSDKDLHVQNLYLLALGELKGAPGVMDHLLPALELPTTQVAAMRAIRQIGTDARASVPQLERLLRAPDPVPIYSMMALSAVGGERAIAILISHATKPGDPLRITAMAALGEAKISEEKMRKSLRAAIETSEPAVAYRAAMTFLQLGEATAKDLRLAIDENERFGFEQTWTHLNLDSAETLFLELLQSKSPDDAKAARQGLNYLDQKTLDKLPKVKAALSGGM